MWLGFIGVLIFSLTLPATRFAVESLEPAWLAIARAVLAALIGAAVLLLSKQAWPKRHHMKSIVAIIVGVVFGFPFFTSVAMKTVDASHGAVVVGLLPMATAIVSAWVNRERLSRTFWICSAAGAAIVLGYAISQGKGALGWGDVCLLLAVACAAVGYAFGGKLSQELGGWQTIAWALLYSLPLMILPLIYFSWGFNFSAVKPRAWFGFLYVSLFSQFIGFFFWYGGMAKAGVARVSQVQLLQLFLTLIFSALINQEKVSLLTWAVAIIIVALVWFIKRLPAQAPSSPQAQSLLQAPK
jgi:drug/metabolite transporter (DMT)-like permease